MLEVFEIIKPKPLATRNSKPSLEEPVYSGTNSLNESDNEIFMPRKDSMEYEVL